MSRREPYSMSQKLISRSPDLSRLLHEGFEVEVVGGRFLRISNVPYVRPNRAVARGAIISTLELAGDVTTVPTDHIVKFVGEHPCNADGTPIDKIRHGSGREQLDRDLAVD